MRRGKRLFANLTMDQLIYDLWARTQAHHLVVLLTPRTLKLLIVDHLTSSDRLLHSHTHINATQTLQEASRFNLSIRTEQRVANERPSKTFF